MQEDILLPILLHLAYQITDYVLQQPPKCTEVFNNVEHMKLSKGNSLNAQDFTLVERWLIGVVQGKDAKSALAIEMHTAASASRGFHFCQQMRLEGTLGPETRLSTTTTPTVITMATSNQDMVQLFVAALREVFRAKILDRKGNKRREKKKSTTAETGKAYNDYATTVIIGWCCTTMPIVV